MADSDKQHELEIELVRMQGRFKGMEKRADNLEDVVSKLTDQLATANETVKNLKQKLTYLAVGVLSFVAHSAPEVFGAVSRIMGLLP